METQSRPKRDLEEIAAMTIAIENITSPSIAASPIEIVERKGLGHPDTICDHLSEELSRSLSKNYLEQFGHVLHNNVDKSFW